MSTQYSLFMGKSQASKVLWYLKTHGSITNMQCHEIFGIRHAPSVIRDIRKKFKEQNSEYEVVNEPEKGCNRFGEPCHWVRYTLKKKSY